MNTKLLSILAPVGLVGLVWVAVGCGGASGAPEAAAPTTPVTVPTSAAPATATTVPRPAPAAAEPETAPPAGAAAPPASTAPPGGPAVRGPRGGAAEPCTPAPVGTTFPAGTVCRNLTIDGYPREYLVHTPAQVAASPTTPVPVVLMFHGSAQSGEQFAEISGWTEKADAEGFVAVFPTGLEYFVKDLGGWQTKWSSLGLADDIDLTKRLPGYPADAPFPADDVGFTNRMIDDVEAHVAVDPDRVYVSGFSNGAAFATRLAGEAGDRVAAVATSGAVAAAYQVPAGRDPAPLWQIVGTKDEKLSESTGVTPTPMDPDAVLALPKVGLAVARTTSGYGLPPERCTTETTPGLTTLGWCAPDRPDYRLSVVKGMAHVYPNGSNGGGLVAADAFWAFFEQHPKR